MKLFHSKKSQRVLVLSILLVFIFGTLTLPHQTSAVLTPIVPQGEAVRNAASATLETTLGTLLAPLANIVLGFSALLLGITGIALNEAIQLTIINMGSFLDAVGSIDIAWTLIRDVINMIFIFIVLLISISIILRTRIGGIDGKKMLTSIIIAALLINFSMFFTRIIIDASNILTREFAKPVLQISGAGELTSGDGSLVSVSGFSGAIMNLLDLQEIYEATTYGNDFFRIVTDFSLITVLLMSSIFLLVAAFVFGAVALLLLIRFVVFMLLLVTSPVAFLGMILPKGSGISGMWWKTLMDQALWAPVFMLLTTISFLILSNPGGEGAILSLIQQNSAGAASGGVTLTGGGADFASSILGKNSAIVINFVIVIGFLIAALMIAKSLAKSGAGKTVDWATKVAGGATLGVAGGIASFAGRETVARGARFVGEKYDAVTSNLTREDRQKWNRRTLGVFGATDRALRGGIKKVEGAKFGGKKSLGEIEKEEGARQIELGKIAVQRSRDKDISDGMETIEKMIATGGIPYDPTDPAIKEFFSAVSKITDKGIEDMLEKKLDLLKKEEFASALTPKHIERIAKAVDEGLISERDRDDIFAARIAGFNSRLDAAQRDAHLDEELARLTSGKAKDVAKIPGKVLVDTSTNTVTPHGQALLANMTPGILSEMVRENTISSQERAVIRRFVVGHGAASNPALAELANWMTTSQWGRNF